VVGRSFRNANQATVEAAISLGVPDRVACGKRNVRRVCAPEGIATPWYLASRTLGIADGVGSRLRPSHDRMWAGRLFGIQTEST